MKKNYKNIVYLILTILLLTACTGQTATPPAENNGQESLYVAPFWKICEGNSTSLCLQVRETTTAEWTLLESPIKGFDFEPGYSYKILVQQESGDNLESDATAIGLSLVEVESKTAVEMPKIDLNGTKWVLVSNSGNAPLADHEITMEFQEEGRLGGTGGCNSYGGDYALQGVSFVPGMMVSTMMACDEPIMSHESAYLSALQSMQYFQQDSGQLLLVNPDGQYLQFKSK